ncbi:uncharacterized protein G2W53_008442 [Senna tora]|uniref:DUF4057 domain-containing protein n=1 Tax=Senna tora TaxID=362788 RepID=A0A834X8I2_9FABA|nr:uncharacterized protein G2W53_008442 [Senna tora]
MELVRYHSVTEESISPKKPTTIPEVAKQRELSGTLNKRLGLKELRSNIKCQDQGNSVDMTIWSSARNCASFIELLCAVWSQRKPAGGQSKILFGEEPAKTTKKIHEQKFHELTGNNIFNGDGAPGSAEKPLSRAKLREMTGSNIFADGKAENRDCLRGARRPPPAAKAASRTVCDHYLNIA